MDTFPLNGLEVSVAGDRVPEEARLGYAQSGPLHGRAVGIIMLQSEKPRWVLLRPATALIGPTFYTIVSVVYATTATRRTASVMAASSTGGASLTFDFAAPAQSVAAAAADESWLRLCSSLGDASPAGVPYSATGGECAGGGRAGAPAAGAPVAGALAAAAAVPVPGWGTILNFCYGDSLLHALLFSSDFRAVMLHLDPPVAADVIDIDSSQSSIDNSVVMESHTSAVASRPLSVHEALRVLVLLWTLDEEPTMGDLLTVKACAAAHNATYKRSRQEDPCDFLHTLLDRSVGDDSGPAVRSLFAFQLRETRTCTRCRRETHVTLESWMVMLPVDREHPSTQPLVLLSLLEGSMWDVEKRTCDSAGCVPGTRFARLVRRFTRLPKLLMMQVSIFGATDAGLSFKIRSQLHAPDVLDLREYVSPDALAAPAAAAAGAAVPPVVPSEAVMRAEVARLRASAAVARVPASAAHATAANALNEEAIAAAVRDDGGLDMQKAVQLSIKASHDEAVQQLAALKQQTSCASTKQQAKRDFLAVHSTATAGGGSAAAAAGLAPPQRTTAPAAAAASSSSAGTSTTIELDDSMAGLQCAATQPTSSQPAPPPGASTVIELDDSAPSVIELDDSASNETGMPPAPSTSHLPSASSSPPAPSSAVAAPPPQQQLSTLYDIVGIVKHDGGSPYSGHYVADRYLPRFGAGGRASSSSSGGGGGAGAGGGGGPGRAGAAPAAAPQVGAWTTYDGSQKRPGPAHSSQGYLVFYQRRR